MEIQENLSPRPNLSHPSSKCFASLLDAFFAFTHSIMEI
jgi:hypothetical protein